jgi:hypothetical protein
MSEPLVYVDTSQVRDGALEEVRAGIAELATFIEANEPELLAYTIYLSEDGTEMTVVHVHRDTRSLEYHLEVGGPAFRKLADLITLSSIHVYGEPSERALDLLGEKARTLGSGTVVVHNREAGFSRLGTD